MKLAKAIEIQDQYQKDHHSYPTDDIGKAEKISVEAMKREQYHRSRNPNQSPNLLPGETED